MNAPTPNRVIRPWPPRIVPVELEQIRVRAAPVGLARAFGVGDIGLRTLPWLAAVLDRTIEAERPDAVLITGSPFYPMLLAPRLARRSGPPVVLDFQDPWVQAPGAKLHRRQPKAWLTHRLAASLEPRAVRAAAFVTSVSDIQNRQMADRYPWLDASRMAAIPIGGDADDFEGLRARPRFGEAAAMDETKINLSYVGTFLPRAGPPMGRLFEAVALLRRRQPQIAAPPALQFRWHQQ